MIRVILSGLILIFLQIFKSRSLAIGGIEPHLLIPYAIFLGWVLENNWSYFIIFLFGLGYDLLMPQTLGLNALVLIVICMITRWFHLSVLEPKLPVIFILSLVTNSLYYLVFGINYLIGKPEVMDFLRIFVFSSIYSSVFSLIMFYILMLIYKLEIRLR